MLEQLETAGTYVLMEDTTELDWTGRAPIPGLGPIGNHREGVQGVRLHSVLAARWPEGATSGEDGRRPAVELIGLCEAVSAAHVATGGRSQRRFSRAQKA